MILVSDAWKQAHKQKLLPETFVEVSMDIANQGFDATITGENVAPFSYTVLLLDNRGRETAQPFAFLEQNHWLLDGSRNVYPEVSYILGFIGNDDQPCTLTIKATEQQTKSILGFTITWSSDYDAYATDFTVEVKNQGVVVGSVSVENNTDLMSVVDLPITFYDEVSIQVQNWSLPGQRPRIDHVLFGHRLIFTKNDILDFSHEQSGCPLGSEISKNAIEFSVDNSDGKWNLMNPIGYAQYLSERQTLTVQYGLDLGLGTEWIKAGTFYLSEWRTSANSIAVTFVARDKTEFLLNATYSRPYVNATVTTDSPVYLTKDEVRYTDGSDKIGTLSAGTTIQVYELSKTYTTGNDDDPDASGWRAALTNEGWINYTKISLSEPSIVSLITEAVKPFAPSNLKTNFVEVLGEDLILKKGPVIVEETPVAEFLQKCGASCGFAMWQRADGYFCISSPKATPSDYVIPLETAYAYPEVELTKPLKQVDVVYHYQYSPVTKVDSYPVGDEGETITVDCPYLWKDATRTESIANKYISFWKCREMVSGEFRADPRLELFDIVTVESKYGKITPVLITNIKYTYNGSFRGTYEGKVIFINYLPISTDEYGFVFNDVGYQSGYRINGTGGIIEYADAGITGFIPFKQGDVLRITASTFTGDINECVSVYDANYGHIRNQYLNRDGTYYTLDGDVYRFDCTGSGTLAPAAYVRITACGIDSTTVVTVNQEVR